VARRSRHPSMAPVVVVGLFPLLLLGERGVEVEVAAELKIFAHTGRIFSTSN
jgi:hypothetical protein